MNVYSLAGQTRAAASLRLATIESIGVAVFDEQLRVGLPGGRKV